MTKIYGVDSAKAGAAIGSGMVWRHWRRRRIPWVKLGRVKKTSIHAGVRWKRENTMDLSLVVGVVPPAARQMYLGAAGGALIHAHAQAQKTAVVPGGFDACEQPDAFAVVADVGIGRVLVKRDVAPGLEVG